MENTADKFIDKHNNGKDYKPTPTNRFYIYHLKDLDNNNLRAFEIGYIENPNKGITYDWKDVDHRVCEGFWGDKQMVEKVVRLLNEC